MNASNTKLSLDLTINSAYQLIKARDPRFDGRFYWGIKTTKIYCRPTCPANPKKENIKIYKSKAEAENAGLRPCLRCRPDLSPTSPLWEGTGAVVSRALKILNSNETESLSTVAQKVGLSDRHLRRLFDEHLGAAPMDIILSNRLHMARGLLSQTSLKITQVAYASGFQSIRRFNDAFQKKYHRNPRDFKKNSAIPLNEEGLTVAIPYLEPFDWEGLCLYFKNHSIYGTEFVDQNIYYRILKIENRIIQLKVFQNAAKKQLIVNIQNAEPKDLKKVIKLVKTVFDIDHNPELLKRHIIDWKGHRIPGSFDPFERMVCIVLGQLISTEQAQQKFKKLMELFGEKVQTSHPNLSILFPTPEKLLKSDLKLLGITRVKQSAIENICRLFIDKKLNIETPVDTIKEQLLEIKGIGPWTVELISLMCLGDTNAYPKSDLILLRAEEKLKLKPEKWAPWRGYLAMWIWRHYALEFSAKGSFKNNKSKKDKPKKKKKLKNKEAIV